MATATISTDHFERSISALVPPNCTFGTPLTDANFHEISFLLLQSGRPSWALRPRVYTILRMIDAVDLMQGFVVDGLLDNDLPFPEDNLPSLLRTSDVGERFVVAQSLVLSIEEPCAKPPATCTSNVFAIQAHFYH